MRRKKAIIVGIVSAALLVGGAAFGLDALDKAYPPPLEAAQRGPSRCWIETGGCCAHLRHLMAAGG